MTPSLEPPQQPRHAAVVALAALWRVVRRGLVFALNILLALILLFEEWGWRPLARAIAWFAKFRLVARLEAWIASLPPYPALAIFALPGALLFPVKLLGLDHGVNTTLGLPFVRTSPDHGTAFDLAGTGRASASSLLSAIDAALDAAPGFPSAG